MEEKLVIEAKRKKKGTKLARKLQELGFTRVEVTKGEIIAEKARGEELSGKTNLDYGIVFREKAIEITYTISQKESKKKRLLQLFPLIIDILLLAEDDYEIKVSTLYKEVSAFFADVGKVVDKDAVDLASEKEELTLKFNDLSKKYAELVRSSEENARLLLECERKRDELQGRVRSLEKMSDDALKEELYKWIKLHEGSLELMEFCESYRVPIARAEEGLTMLIQDGYIKKRSE